jgi:pyridoxine 5-phosphate synthase
MPKLGVNIDHIATLRQLRHSVFPDLILTARTCEASGADSIVVHLREDRRHVQESDVRSLRRIVKTKLNLEMSMVPSIVRIACQVRPDQATLVPEKRQELTTEGGLNIVRCSGKIGSVVETLKRRKIDVSLFIEPDKRQIRASKAVGADIIELHTGRYANSRSVKEKKNNIVIIKEASLYALSLGLVVSAGHGLDYTNVCPVAGIPGIHELNIGYSIVCHSVFVGLDKAVRQMKRLIR